MATDAFGAVEDHQMGAVGDDMRRLDAVYREHAVTAAMDVVERAGSPVVLPARDGVDGPGEVLRIGFFLEVIDELEVLCRLYADEPSFDRGDSQFAALDHWKEVAWIEASSDFDP